MSDVSHESVRGLAWRARLRLSDAEIERLAQELGRILEYVDALRRLDIAGVPPTSHVLGLRDVLRDDVPGRCLDRGEVLRRCAGTDGEHFVVQAVLPSTDT